VPHPPVAPQESSLNGEPASIVFLEMDDERAAISGEPEAIPMGYRPFAA
jgi:hypothetical protein